MLTNNLEKLILAGKASYNTFVAGGSQKHVLNVYNDRFIIITDITYQSSVNLIKPTSENLNMTFEELKALLSQGLNSQLRIFSKKSMNQFLFRNQLSITPNGANFNVMPFGSIKLETYLIHEDDVSFTFSRAGNRQNIDTGFSETDSIAFAPPYDYGKDGQPGVLPVRLVSGASPAYKTSNSGQNKVNAADTIDLELSFPVDATTNFQNLDNSAAYPVLIIGYVEILGNPTNLSATL